MKTRILTAALVLTGSMWIVGCGDNSAPAPSGTTGGTSGTTAGSTGTMAGTTGTTAGTTGTMSRVTAATQAAAEDVQTKGAELITKIQEGLAGVPTKDSLAKVQTYVDQLNGIKDKLPDNLKATATSLIEKFNQAKQALNAVPANIPGMGH